MFEISLHDHTLIYATKAEIEKDGYVRITGKVVRVVPGPKGGPTLMAQDSHLMLVYPGLIGMVTELPDNLPHLNPVRRLLTGIVVAQNLPEDSTHADPGFKLVED